ncbi:MAG: hypothetical protein ACLQMF_05445 [Rectinemataceae bacterium]
MVLKDPAIFAAIEAIGEHYRANISNRYTQRALDAMNLDLVEVRRFQDLFEKSANYRYQRFHLDELYAQIFAAARFASCARSQVLPTLRIESLSLGGRQNNQDRVLRDMAVNIFGPNLDVLADKIGDLNSKAVDLDKEAAGRGEPIYTRLPELGELGRYLSGCD